MNITYQVEKYADAKEEMIPLTECNYEEDDARREVEALNIDWELYDTLEDQGSVILITSRDAGKLVGYLSLYLTEQPHIKDFVQAASDAVYVALDYRGSGVGCGMLKAAEAALRAAGVGWLSVSFRTEELARNLMSTLGYKQTDVVYGKSLEGEV